MRGALTTIRHIRFQSMGPVEAIINQKLKESFKPSFLSVINESRLHGFRKGKESHFNLTVVSDAFDGQRPVNRQRSVNKLLKEEFKEGGLHALSMSLRTEREHEELEGSTHKTPPCSGKS
ncbi:Oidioi.mRNA.OKI2018_I69.PAR.g10631.t1.cds [Oikopleura dioica]|uniref:Oidioi.mRNA.OKI2018_I69.PAR.g10631.t1.cds n=1 Tax=Oikopleura dioica TaxID=34765 RepID=A0ABN7RUR8_OIKDI|nr:Oidioi.mRNA.OKI2018_I69.PAR.g10631.t1.cds [Oikopleura dioica]